MKYKMFAIASASLLVAACDFGGNVYPMSQQDAYDKLVSAHIEPGGKGVFGRLESSVSGNGSSVVHWTASGTFASISCEADIVPEGADKSRINAFCGGSSPSEGAASGMFEDLNRKALIEHIDATLRGRPYDPQLALGATAGSWPDDPRQADASIGTAAGEALKMDQEMRQSAHEAAVASADMEPQVQQQGPTITPGEPMVNVAR